MMDSKNLSLLFIAGIGHSGSTAFDLLLGAQPGITGMGEIDVFLNPESRQTFIGRFDKYPCTCGEEPSDCPVWSGFKERLIDAGPASYGELYGELIERTVKHTGAKVMVDSSKNIYALKSVYRSLSEMGISREQFYVIHLTKDLRNYTASSVVNSNRSSSLLKNFRDWVSKNREIEDFIVSEGIQCLNVGYDELMLSTSHVMREVLEFLGLKSDQMVLDMGKSGSHIISGNNMRLDQADKIYYDYRWFLNSRIQFWFSLLPIVTKLHRKWVYSNVESSLEKDSKFEAPK